MQKKTFVLPFVAMCLLASPAWAMAAPVQSHSLVASAAKPPRDMPGFVQDSAEDVLAALGITEKMIFRGAIVQEGNSLNHSTWKVSYSASDSKSKPTSVSITIDSETGDFVKASIRYETEPTKAPAKAIAREKAKAFANALFHGDYQMDESVAIDDHTYPEDRTACVTFYEKVQGIPLKTDWIKVNVDGNGRIVSIERKTSEDQVKKNLPKATPGLTAEQAKQAYGKQLEMKLVYDPNAAEKGNPALRYVPVYKGAIDAATGKRLDLVDNYLPAESCKISGKGMKLTASSIDAVKKLLKEDFAVDVQNMIYKEEKITEEKEIKGEMTKQVREIVYTWTPDGMNPQPRAKVIIDAKTSVIKAISINELSTSKADGTSKDKARQSALRFAEKYMDASISEVQLQQEGMPAAQMLPDWVNKQKLQADIDERERSAYTFLIRYAQRDTLVRSGQLKLRFDAGTGNLIGLTNESLDLGGNLPKASQVVAADAAKQAYLNDLAMRPIYVAPSYLGEDTATPLLAYVPVQPVEDRYVDALTGKVIEE